MYRITLRGSKLSLKFLANLFFCTPFIYVCFVWNKLHSLTSLFWLGTTFLGGEFNRPILGFAKTQKYLQYVYTLIWYIQMLYKYIFTYIYLPGGILGHIMLLNSSLSLYLSIALPPPSPESSHREYFPTQKSIYEHFSLPQWCPYRRVCKLGAAGRG